MPVDRYAIHQRFAAEYYGRARLYALDGERLIVRLLSEEPPAVGRYRFVLDCNPTQREAVTGKRRAARDPVGWLSRQAERFGFAVESVKWRSHSERFLRKGLPGYVCGVEFRGVLRIEDAAAFLLAWRDGLGSAKAIGFGMIRLEINHASA